MRSPAISSFLAVALISLLGWEGYQILNELTALEQLSSVKRAPSTQPEEPAVNLEALCEELYQKTEECLDNANMCIDVLNEYSEKNKVFEAEVKKCQDRSEKNTKKNAELKKKLDEVQAKTKKAKEAEAKKQPTATTTEL